MEKIKKRFELGYKTYGHGIRVMNDTRNWGTQNNSWLEMAEEEILDALIYCAADIIRKENISKDSNEDSNEHIKEILDTKGKYEIVDDLWSIYNKYFKN